MDKSVKLIRIKKIDDLRTSTLFFKFNFQLMMTQVYLKFSKFYQGWMSVELWLSLPRFGNLKKTHTTFVS